MRTGPISGEFLLSPLCLVVECLRPGAAASISAAGPPLAPTMATLVSSSPAARCLDEAQYAAGTGPCPAAIGGRAEVRGALDDDRWPALAEMVSPGSFRYGWSLPLMAGSTALGSLNIYSEVPAPLQAGPELFAAAVAVTAQAVAHLAALEEASDQIGNLKVALATRTVIGQAQGILMARQGVSAERAFDVLRRASQRSNRKLHDIAAEIVSSAIDPAH